MPLDRETVGAGLRTRLLLFALGVVSAGVAARPAAYAAKIPQFAAYPASPGYHGRNAEPQLSTPEARTYRTRLREAAKERPNFAGRYILTTWGCGTSCVMGAVIDAQSGRVTFLPATVCCWSVSVDDGFRPVEARLTSRLIVLSGLLDEKGTMGSHFVFDGHSFAKLATIEMPDDFGASKGATPRAP